MNSIIINLEYNSKKKFEFQCVTYIGKYIDVLDLVTIGGAISYAIKEGIDDIKVECTFGTKVLSFKLYNYDIENIEKRIQCYFKIHQHEDIQQQAHIVYGILNPDKVASPEGFSVVNRKGYYILSVNGEEFDHFIIV